MFPYISIHLNAPPIIKCITLHTTKKNAMSKLYISKQKTRACKGWRELGHFLQAPPGHNP